MGNAVQFIFISTVLLLSFSKNFYWMKFFLVTLVFFVLTLKFPLIFLNKGYSEVFGSLGDFLMAVYVFCLFYPLPALVVLILRKLIKIKINVILDFIIQCIAFFIFLILIYVVLLFIPLCLLYGPP